MEVTARSSWALMDVGLSRSQSIPAPNDLRLGLRFQSGVAEVRENGTYRADVRYRDGDKFMIRIKEGRVTYAHNGRVFYTGNYSDPYRMYAAVSFQNLDAALEDIRLYAD